MKRLENHVALVTGGGQLLLAIIHPAPSKETPRGILLWAPAQASIGLFFGAALP
ncbi:hypothetical protein [Tepidiphilus sp. HLB4]|nr:hypothetical protein [Tepidiphilus sp.]MDD3432543.1 hypothetical protein [Tepidiphilus sp.]